jgi:hypothetical protein
MCLEKIPSHFRRTVMHIDMQSMVIGEWCLGMKVSHKRSLNLRLEMFPSGAKAASCVEYPHVRVVADLFDRRSAIHCFPFPWAQSTDHEIRVKRSTTFHLSMFTVHYPVGQLSGVYTLYRPTNLNSHTINFSFFFLGVGWDWVHLARRPLTGLLYQPWVFGDWFGADGGMRIGRGNRSTRRKPAPVPLCPPQIPHDLTWARTRAAPVGSRRLTGWTTINFNAGVLHFTDS